MYLYISSTHVRKTFMGKAAFASQTDVSLFVLNFPWHALK